MEHQPGVSFICGGSSGGGDPGPESRARPGVTVWCPSPRPGRRRPLAPLTRGRPTTAGAAGGRERGGQGGGDRGSGEKEEVKPARSRSPPDTRTAELPESWQRRPAGRGCAGRRPRARNAARPGPAASPALRTLSPPFSPLHLPRAPPGQGLPGTGRCQRRGSNPWPEVFLPTAGEAAEPPSAPERGTRAADGTHRAAGAPSPCPGGSR